MENSIFKHFQKFISSSYLTKSLTFDCSNCCIFLKLHHSLLQKLSCRNLFFFYYKHLSFSFWYQEILSRKGIPYMELTSRTYQLGSDKVNRESSSFPWRITLKWRIIFLKVQINVPQIWQTWGFSTIFS